MFQIQNVTSDAKQRQTLVLPDGGLIFISISFVEMQLGWFIRELSYENFIVNGVRIVNSPNILHQFRNQIPFGLACFSADNREPQFQDDFSSGASKLYVLSAEEVEQYTEHLSGQV